MMGIGGNYIELVRTAQSGEEVSCRRSYLGYVARMLGIDSFDVA